MSAAERAADRETVLALRQLERALRRLEAAQDGAADTLELDGLAVACALMQSTRKRLTELEATFAGALGVREGRHVGYLPDGRQYSLERYPDRKAWDHDDWKRDVRREVIREVADRYVAPDGFETIAPEVELVDLSTGETVVLGRVMQEALDRAQAAHGSQAPKSTVLRQLGLNAGDYCEQSPGGWKFAAVKPNDGGTA